MRHVARYVLPLFLVAYPTPSLLGQANVGTPTAGAPAVEPAKRNRDPRLLADAVAGVLHRALADSAFPGAYAIVGSRTGILTEMSVGRLDWATSPAPSPTTLWDLASLTKVVALTSAMIDLVARDLVDLDAPVQRYLPDWTGPGKERVRVRDLLTHSAGLPSWRPLYKESETPADAMRLVLATPLEREVGQQMVYSDLGAILLGEIVRRVSKQPLERLVTKRVFTPLGMRETMFNPPSHLRTRIAPTEQDPWRQRKLRGEVHDENAFRLGGVSAHAGLFSTARDLARFARMYLNFGQLDGVRVLDSATIRTFIQRQNPALSHRALGWETATGSNSAGTLMSSQAFGHTGFTGTSIWMDPGNDIFVILLSNRVNPTRENRKIGWVRTALADTVLSWLGATSGSR